KWCLLFYASGASAEAAQVMSARLRLAKRDVEAIGLLLKILHEISPTWDRPQTIEWGRWLIRYGFEICQDAEMLLAACWWN
ncbi:hypothetical protein MXD81_26805, partial [Microbacteriaceae bacterium K1510]|nr:hypothetical protein [Microbacteriaceae bacterium K1510]